MAGLPSFHSSSAIIAHPSGASLIIFKRLFGYFMVVLIFMQGIKPTTTNKYPKHGILPINQIPIFQVDKLVEPTRANHAVIYISVWLKSMRRKSAKQPTSAIWTIHRWFFMPWQLLPTSFFISWLRLFNLHSFHVFVLIPHIQPKTTRQSIIFRPRHLPNPYNRLHAIPRAENIPVRRIRQDNFQRFANLAPP